MLKWFVIDQIHYTHLTDNNRYFRVYCKYNNDTRIKRELKCIIMAVFPLESQVKFKAEYWANLTFILLKLLDEQNAFKSKNESTTWRAII